MDTDDKKRLPLIRKELVKLFDETVKKVHVGFFPPKGRYFRKEMINMGNGCFQLDAFLPKGTSFCHYFFNGDFEMPKNNEQDIISKYDSQKRAPLVMESAVFCPVEFSIGPNFISHVKDNMWEFRAVTYHSWIEKMELVMPFGIHPMIIAYRYKNCTFWSARLALDNMEIDFYLKISGGLQTKYLHKDYKLKDQPSEGHYFHYSLVGNKGKNDHASSFRAGYQILPDRFHRIAESPAPATLKAWGDSPDLQTYFGGNIPGIIEKLEYIAGLGVNFIYLNPVFFAQSPHRYDCIDYLMIDPLLGSNDDFKTLVDKAHALKLKVILDISLNHCSTRHFAFRDLLQNQERSLFRNWYEVEGFPVSPGNNSSYSCWHGYKELPQFNLDNSEVQNYFTQVARHWMKEYRIDGWRLDVCVEMPAGFVNKFIRETRKINPDAVMVAETWQNDAPEIMQDNEMAGITNYTFYLNVIIPFFERDSLPVSLLAYEIMRVGAKSSFKNTIYSWNFLSNHDIPRFYSILKNKKNLFLAYSLMYVLPGIPLIYYGEENLMEGLTDPANRGCMDFTRRQEDNEFLPFLKEWNGIRERHIEVLTYGSLFFPLADDEKKILVIGRSFHDEYFYLLLNFDDKTHYCTISSKGSGGSRNTIHIKEHNFKIIHDTPFDFGGCSFL
ncbi:glycoside hydrolase family 13 protein [Flavitalea flava]